MDQIFDICPTFCVSGYEFGTKFRLIVVYLLRKKHGNRGFRFWQLFNRYRKYGQHKSVQISEESTISPAWG